MRLGWVPSLFLYICGILLICLSFRNALRTKNKMQQRDWKKQLEDEHAIQFVRNKPLDSTLLIQVSTERFKSVEHTECMKQYHVLMRQTKLPMVNLKGMSNMALKKQYGPQIIEDISTYERNYFQFMQSALSYAELLLQNDYVQECQSILEECISYHCDISKCYMMLAGIYRSQNNAEALAGLKSIVQQEMSGSPFLHKVLSQFNDDLKVSV